MMKTKPLTILFVIRNTTGLYNYKSILCSLFLRGHQVKVSFERIEENWTRGVYLEHLKEFQGKYQEFVYDFSQVRRDRWTRILLFARIILSYRRFLYTLGQSTYYRDRYITYLPLPLKIAIYTPLVSLLIKSFLKSSVAERLLLSLERHIPPYAPIREEIERMNPDVVISSAGNLILSSADVEYIKAASSLGIPTVFPIISWDYLATKGILPPYLDELLVWNEAQLKEAKEHHHFPNARMHVTGAPYFDDWFTVRNPSMTRKEFCLFHGLREQDPIVVYLGSSKNMAKDETGIVRELRHALDVSSDSRMCNTQIIVRPHPANIKIYKSLELRDVVVIPKKGSLPDTTASFQLFYDTLFHAVAAIVGVNTTAVIESIVAGKPCIAVLTEEYRKTQRDTIHFQQLLDADALEQARSCADVPSLLISLLDGKDMHRSGREAFIAKYIRPRGITTPAGEIVADEVERIAENSRSARIHRQAEEK